MLKELSVLHKLLRKAFEEWKEDRAVQLGAAISFYAVLSFIPTLILLISLLGFVLGQNIAQEEIFSSIAQIVGERGSDFIQGMVQGSDSSSSNLSTALFSLAILLIGATGAFSHLRDALNTIWATEKKRPAIRKFMGKRIIAFAMVVSIGLVFLVSLLMQLLLSFLGLQLLSLVPSVLLAYVILFVSLLVTFVLIGLFFAVLLKVLPDQKLEWNDVLGGAFVAAFLFVIAKYLFSLYFNQVGVATSFGAVSSFIGLLIWMFISIQILLFGAEFSKIYARVFGSLRFRKRMKRIMIRD